MVGELKKGSSKEKAKSDGMVFNDDTQYRYHCTACGKGFMRQRDNFNISPSPYYKGNNGFLHICKRCLEKSFDYYKDEVCGGDQDKAMELVCATINTCFDETAWANAKKTPPTRSRVSAYFSKLNLGQTKGASYADTIMLRKENQVENIASIKQMQDNPDIAISLETVQLFGVGFTEQEYETLQFEYEDWEKNMVRQKISAKKRFIKLSAI